MWELSPSISLHSTCPCCSFVSVNFIQHVFIRAAITAFTDFVSARYLANVNGDLSVALTQEQVAVAPD